MVNTFSETLYLRYATLSSVFRGGGHAAMAPPSESPKAFFDEIDC